MNAEKLKTIIEQIESVKIAVIGDFCLDAYWFIDNVRIEISVETQKTSQPIKYQKYSLGGAVGDVNKEAKKWSSTEYWA